MSNTQNFSQQAKSLIDDLKSVCADHGLGNEAGEYKIITQIFLYKFLHDKFVFEIKQLDDKLKQADDWEEHLKSLGEDDFEMLTMGLSESSLVLKPDHLISSLFAKQNKPNFADIFDNTFVDIAQHNNDIFSVLTAGGEKITIFEKLSRYVTDKPDDFCRATVNKLVEFSFENMFEEGFDFFADIFEYLIKDYNSDSGGQYAEYFTPHAISKIMARCLVTDDEKGNINNVTCYDPSAGSGTLLMNLAHQIREDKCTIFSQDISQKSSHLLRLNLILNKLVHSIHNIIQGNTLLAPAHKNRNNSLMTFDYVIANPPFKLNFSEYRDDLDKKENNDRFFTGIPKVPAKKKAAMEIYLVFLQHIIFSLKPEGKGAIVVPTGFITARMGIASKLLHYLIDEKIVRGVISMPPNVFGRTGTSVSILFIDKTKANQSDVILIDASNLGEQIRVGKNQKTVLRPDEIEKVITTFTNKKAIEDFSVSVSYDEIIAKKYSLSAGQHFDIKIEYVDISKEEFENKLQESQKTLESYFEKSKVCESKIKDILERLFLDVSK